MTTITELHANIQELLTEVAEREGRRSGFIRRRRQLSGAGFAQALILGGIQSPQATRSEQHQHALQAGQHLSKQGFEQRVEQAERVTFMKALLEASLTRLVSREQAGTIFPVFKGVYLTDCTRLEWSGLGFKAGVRLEVALMDVQANDQTTSVVERTLPQGALHLADLGFFKIARFAQWSEAGVYWLTRYKVGTSLFTPDGRAFDLVAALQQATEPLTQTVHVGSQRLPARLLAAPLDASALAKRMTRLREQARLDQKPIPQRQLDLCT